MIRSAVLTLASLGVLAGCDAPGGQSAPVYPYGFSPKPYAGAPQSVPLQASAPLIGPDGQPLPAPLARAVAANPSDAQIQAQLQGKDFLDLTPDDIAALSLMAARDMCNLPEGTPITSATPCLPAR